MRMNIPGLALSMIIMVLMLLVCPLYYIGIIEMARSQEIVLAETRNVIDRVIDTREFTDEMREDYMLALASQSTYYRATITRECKVIDPDPVNPGKTRSSYLIADDTSKYVQGDIITIEVNIVGQNFFQTIARSFLGLAIREDNVRLSARVR
jgi:hypothetical protein